MTHGSLVYQPCPSVTEHIPRSNVDLYGFARVLQINNVMMLVKALAILT